MVEIDSSSFDDHSRFQNRQSATDSTVEHLLGNAEQLRRLVYESLYILVDTRLTNIQPTVPFPIHTVDNHC